MRQVTIKSRVHCWCQWLCLLLLFATLPFQATAAGPAISAEYKLKAALIYKLTRFVEWPATVSSKLHNNFGICLLGRDDFGRELDLLEGRMVGDATISIHRFNQSESIGTQCQLVFISGSKQAFLRPILRSLGQNPILTIGDSVGFAEKGGMIQLTRDGKRIVFSINLQRANISGLKIAAPLLRLATIVGQTHKAGAQ